MNKEKRMAIIIVDDQKNEKGEYIPCIVKKGEQGFWITDWHWGKDRGVAQKLADDYNAKLGLSKEEVMQLTLESMRDEVKKQKGTVHSICQHVTIE